MNASDNSPENRKTRKAVVAAFISSQLRPGDNGLGTAPPLAPGDIPMASIIRLNIDQVHEYEHNPRTQANPKYEDIRDSIKQRGLDQRMTVTRRPGEQRYVLAYGGGTRLKALRELWESSERKDRRFYELDFDLRPYEGEAALLAASLSENLNRGDMCFWDCAKGYMDLKEMLQNEKGISLTSVRDTAEAFKVAGHPNISKTIIHIYEFAVAKFCGVNTLSYKLNHLAVQEVIQPRYNEYVRLAKSFSITQSDFDDQVWHPAIADFNPDTVDSEDIWSAVLTKVSSVLAASLHVPETAVPRLLEVLKLDVSVSESELRALAEQPPIADDAGGALDADEFLAREPQSDGEPEEDDQPAPQFAVAASEQFAGGHRARSRMPGTFEAAETVYMAPADGDRPPPEIVEEEEAEQRARAKNARDARLSTREQGPLVGGESEAPLIPVKPTGGPFQRRKTALLALAQELARESRSLDGLIVESDAMPLGWLIDLPMSVVNDTALAPQARQVFWCLAHASFQLHVGLQQPDRVAGTRFGQFLASVSVTRWALVKPQDGFDFLGTWLIDPAYSRLGMLAVRVMTSARDLIANHPRQFPDLEQALDFEDLQAAHLEQLQQREQDELLYFVRLGANAEMVRNLFPDVDLDSIRFRPGRCPEINLETAQKLYTVWERITQEEALERVRYMRLHEALPDVPLAALYAALVGDRIEEEV